MPFVCINYFIYMKEKISECEKNIFGRKLDCFLIPNKFILEHIPFLMRPCIQKVLYDIYIYHILYMILTK